MTIVFSVSDSPWCEIVAQRFLYEQDARCRSWATIVGDKKAHPSVVPCRQGRLSTATNEAHKTLIRSSVDFMENALSRWTSEKCHAHNTLWPAVKLCSRPKQCWVKTTARYRSRLIGYELIFISIECAVLYVYCSTTRIVQKYLIHT